MYVCVCVRVYVYVCVCMCVYMCACVCVCVSLPSLNRLNTDRFSTRCVDNDISNEFLIVLIYSNFNGNTVPTKPHQYFIPIVSIPQKIIKINCFCRHCAENWTTSWHYWLNLCIIQCSSTFIERLNRTLKLTHYISHIRKTLSLDRFSRISFLQLSWTTRSNWDQGCQIWA